MNWPPGLNESRVLSRPSAETSRPSPTVFGSSRGTDTVGLVGNEASSSEFDRAIGLVEVADGHLRGEILDGWDIRGGPHGGYLLAMLGAAGRTQTEHPDPVSSSATYLSPPGFGPTDLFVEVVRAGKRQTTVSVRLIQGDLERVRADLTYSTLGLENPDVWMPDANRPEIVSPESCVDIETSDNVAETAINLHRYVSVLFDPATGWLRSKPTGQPQLDGWLRFVDGREPDPIAMLLFADGFPPSIFEGFGTEVGHVPTVQLTTHQFAKPGPGWVQARFRTRVRGGKYVDEDGELWDRGGRLVATARQLGLIRPARGD